MDNPTRTAPLKRPRPVTLPADLRDMRILRPAEVAEMLRCSRSHVYRLAKAGILPPSIRISHCVSGWRVGDVLNLLDQRQAAAYEAK